MYIVPNHRSGVYIFWRRRGWENDKNSDWVKIKKHEKLEHFFRKIKKNGKKG